MQPTSAATPAAAATTAADALSFQGLRRLGAAAAKNPGDAATIKAVAQQFEALLLQQMLSSMGNNAFGPDLLGETAGPMLKSFYHQQLASTMSQGAGLGLGRFLARELAVRYGATPPATPPALPGSPTATSAGARAAAAATATPSASRGAANNAAPSVAPSTDVAAATTRPARTAAPSAATAAPASPLPAPAVASKTSSAPADARQAATTTTTTPAAQFLAGILPHVERAAAALRVHPVALLAQAALETGWGQHTPGNNLFGIKAGSPRDTAQTLSTTEYTALGRTVERAAFRIYEDVAASVDGFTRLLSTSSRYAVARGQQDVRAYAHAMQRAGYATDPGYAEKLLAVADSPKMRAALAALGRADWLPTVGAASHSSPRPM